MNSQLTIIQAVAPYTYTHTHKRHESMKTIANVAKYHLEVRFEVLP